ncbi:MAG: hypothetical protein ACHQSE_10015 [Gemmatimonadales bacterium]
MTFQHVLILSLVAIVACGRDRSGDTADPPDQRSTALSPEQYRQRQQAIAESLLASSRPVEKVVEELGQSYAIGPDALRDTIVALAQGTTCFEAGRNTDPYLAGTVNIMARMTPTGTDLVRVLAAHTRWTSAAGDLVNACLNTEMRRWKLDAHYGKPAGYVVQVQFGAATSR